MADHEGVERPEKDVSASPGQPGAGRTAAGYEAGLDDRDRNTMYIPRIIHRIWVGGLLPEQFRIWGNTWKELNPGWELWDWGDSGALAEYPLRRADLRARAREIIPHDWERFQADVLRLELLYEFGGLYVDMDVEPHMPIEPFLLGRTCLLARSPNKSSTGYHAITNCVMAAAPKHPFIRALLDGLDDAIAKHSHRHLAQMIGPWHIDRTYNQQDWTKDSDIEVLDWAFVKPWLTHYWNNARRKRGEGLG